MNPLRIINSIAPIRICDLGGWTDTWFAKYGAVFNIAVYPYAEVQLKTFPCQTDNKKKIIIHAENFGKPYELNADNIIYDKHPLIEAAIDMIGVPKEIRFEAHLYSNAPSGASTGTSAAVTVALIAALDLLTKGKMTPYEVALAAQKVETEKLGQQCGVQDQLASAYGGLNYIQMSHYPNCSVSPIYLDNSTWWELERRLVLIYLGKAHYSSELHKKVIRKLEGAGSEYCVLKKLRNIAKRGVNALYDKDFVSFGKVMVENNELQRELHYDLISKDADLIINAAKKNGALGWKVNGAGGDGGSVTILCGYDGHSKRKIIADLEEINPKFLNVPIYISRYGLRLWES